mmetsp:Transcript_3467/g.5051  ORF Transcript_3467/g.5051 Transcript_3467/m.5051 type:complete len:149 (-) Transcript_3467:443-889(-)
MAMGISKLFGVETNNRQLYQTTSFAVVRRAYQVQLDFTLIIVHHRDPLSLSPPSNLVLFGAASSTLLFVMGNGYMVHFVKYALQSNTGAHHPSSNQLRLSRLTTRPDLLSQVCEKKYTSSLQFGISDIRRRKFGNLSRNDLCNEYSTN